ncbi:response regulator [Nevskia soli]|uniref:response regulator n=1 Tax=Nevskia soli TaxID=418856 RepID=UPI0004A6F93F|nr:response regulator [Nevskia soli]
MRTRQPLIFFVHDDDRMLAAIRPLADASGWRIDAFASAQQCLEAMVREQPDALLTELSLLDMHGVQLLKAMDILGLAIPVIAIGEERVTPLSDQAIAVGALAVLHAPFWDEELVGAIETAIAARAIFIEAFARSAHAHAG